MAKYISVRCCPNFRTLWFHLEGVRFATGTCHIGIRKADIEPLEKGMVINRSRTNAWAALTPDGRQITKQILNLSCMPQPAEIWGRPKYFDLSLPPDVSVEVWDEVLPTVVSIIREVSGKQLQLRREPPRDRSIEEWHLPLLRRHGARV